MNPLLTALINGWWQGIVLTLLVWLVLRELRSVSATTKLAIWQVTLAIVVLLPALQQIPRFWLTANTAGPVVSAARAVTQAPAPQVTRQSEARPPSPAPQAAERSRPVFEVDQNFPAVFAGIAAVLAGFQMLRLLFAFCAVRRLKRKARLTEMALPVNVARRVDIRISPTAVMPLAAGYRHAAVLLPQYLVDRLTPEEMNYVLLHEAAHLQRRDDWVMLAERILRALFSFQPAVYWIGRQIEQQREMACDDWVTALAGHTKAYAGSLARLAELGSSRREPILAMGVGRPKAIFARLEAMLDRARNRMPVVSEPVVVIATVLLILLALQGTSFSHLLGFSNFQNHWIESDGSHRREFKMRGDVEFTPAGDDVQSMSPGAMLVIEQSDEFRNWRIEFEADQDGVIQRRYFSGRSQRPFDKETRKLLSNILPEWVREMGKDIPEHLARMLREKGTAGALDDVRSIRSNGVKREYLEELQRQVELQPEEMTRMLKVASGMDSDDDKRQFLENLLNRASSRTEDTLVQALACLDTIHSDDDRRKLLMQIVEREPASPSLLARLSRSVAQMESDSDKAAVLVRASGTSTVSLPAEFFTAAATIHSDDDQEHVLTSALQAHETDPLTIPQVLHNAAAMNSDDQKTRVLVAVAKNVRGTSETLPAIGHALETIHNDDDRRRVIEALLDANGKNPEMMAALLAETSKLDSDDDKSHLLLHMTGIMTAQEPVLRAFFSAVDSLHSPESQRQILLAVLARTDFTADTVRQVSQAALRIQSLPEQVAVLKAATMIQPERGKP